MIFCWDDSDETPAQNKATISRVFLQQSVENSHKKWFLIPLIQINASNYKCQNTNLTDAMQFIAE